MISLHILFTIYLVEYICLYAVDNPITEHRVLVLCGNSGCGKSTALELLCREMNIGVKVWTDDCWDTDVSSGGSIFASQQWPPGAAYPEFRYTSSDGVSSLANRRSHDALFSTRQQSKVRTLIQSLYQYCVYDVSCDCRRVNFPTLQ